MKDTSRELKLEVAAFAERIITQVYGQETDKQTIDYVSKRMIDAFPPTIRHKPDKGKETVQT